MNFKNIIMNKQEYTITVYTENQIGLLNRIAIIFSRRKINIEIEVDMKGNDGSFFGGHIKMNDYCTM